MNRVADVFLDPLFVSLLALVLALALRRRAPRVAAGVAVVGGLLLFVFSLPTVGNRLAWANEEPAATTMDPGATYDAVIVLGGATNGIVTLDTGQTAFGESVDRVLTAFDLLRTNRARFAILSGTSWDAAPGGPPPEARLIATTLEAWGIDPARLVTDDLSRNTHENAIESARIARAHGWSRNLLVTSAAHMLRARGCFAAEGLAVDTLAVDFGAYDPARHASGWLPRASALAESTGAIRERVGRWVYRLRGWTR